MLAVHQDRYGSPDVLRVRERDRPNPRPGEILVRVRAASVNAYDWHLMRGDPYLMRLSMGIRRPKDAVRGRDFAGRVEQVGADVVRFRPGDEVFGEAAGTFADYVCVRQDWAAPKPARLSFEQAAAVPLAANTALMGLRDAGRVRAGQRVLVNGASGGVGTFAVQIAKALGATVTGVCSTRNVELVRSIGADEVVDYTRDDFTRTGGRHDVVFDLVGNRSLTDLRQSLAPRGVLVLSGGGASEGGSLVGPMGLVLKGSLLRAVARQRVVVLSARPDAANLDVLRELAESGAISPVVDRTYRLVDAPAAIRYVEEEHARGKVVISQP